MSFKKTSGELRWRVSAGMENPSRRLFGRLRGARSSEPPDRVDRGGHLGFVSLVVERPGVRSPVPPGFPPDRGEYLWFLSGCAEPFENLSNFLRTSFRGSPEASGMRKRVRRSSALRSSQL